MGGRRPCSLEALDRPRRDEARDRSGERLPDHGRRVSAWGGPPRPRLGSPGVGKLYLVATPIGNLEDVSPRALRILQDAHMVACEDTRHTQILLRKYEIRAKHLTSYNEFNHRQKVGELVRMLDREWDVALVSDAAPPALSDPGEALVARAIDPGHQ